MEHIIPASKGGSSRAPNYALSCFNCNLSKSAQVTGIDPKTELEEPLFHPRKDRWADHFRWVKNFTAIQGKTATGRATVDRLKMNSSARVIARRLWRATGIWP